MTTPPIEAVVIAGATKTTYERAGSGQPVLLLFPGRPRDPFAATLFEQLAKGARVIAPTQPRSDPSFDAWLRDLIDGLGLLRTTLVADEPLVGAALAFAQVEPERVGAFISVGRPVTGDAAAAAARVATKILALLERRD
jgi:hypothetical protein